MRTNPLLCQQTILTWSFGGTNLASLMELFACCRSNPHSTKEQHAMSGRSCHEMANMVSVVVDQLISAFSGWPIHCHSDHLSITISQDTPVKDTLIGNIFAN
eukprot:1610965-Amphidinium_carterae.1